MTIVLVNNGGGNIFHFLPVASHVEADEFTRLFETPPDVRFSEICRANRVMHLQARTPKGLGRALTEAWRLGRHCVVEVVLRSDDQGVKNLRQHRSAEASVRAAVRRALAAARATFCGDASGSGSKESAGEGRGGGMGKANAAGAASEHAVRSTAADVASGHGDRDREASNGLASTSRAAGAVPSRGQQRLLSPLGAEELRVRSVDVAPFALPLTRPVTAADPSGAAADPFRRGFLIRIELAGGAVGVGEASPLPGLHSESLAEAGTQARLLSRSLPGAVLSPQCAVLDGSLADWLERTAGIGAAALVPSVKFGLETALLAALAAAQGLTLAELLLAGGNGAAAAAGGAGAAANAPLVNALLPAQGESPVPRAFCLYLFFPPRLHIVLRGSTVAACTHAHGLLRRAKKGERNALR